MQCFPLFLQLFSAEYQHEKEKFFGWLCLKELIIDIAYFYPVRQKLIVNRLETNCFVDSS